MTITQWLGRPASTFVRSAPGDAADSGVLISSGTLKISECSAPTPPLRPHIRTWIIANELVERAGEGRTSSLFSFAALRNLDRQEARPSAPLATANSRRMPPAEKRGRRQLRRALLASASR